MNATGLMKLLAFSGATICMNTTPGLSDGQNCEHVGGSVLTNFLAAADCAASPVKLCTDGPATGDLRGAVGVTVLAVNGNVLHNHHHRVTESGDTIFFNMPI